MSIETEEQGLLDDIRQHPEDDQPRLVYADWLDEQGDPGCAEFIKTQVVLASAKEVNGLALSGERQACLRQREQALLAGHRQEWEAALREQCPAIQAVEFRRGLPYHITIPAGDFLTHAEHLFALAPIRSVQITGISGIGRLQNLAASAHLASLTTLDLGGNGISAAGVEALAGSEHLRNLTTLNLWDNDIGDAGVEALAGSEHLRNLTTLSLWYNGIGEAGARALAGSEHLRNLTSLNLGHNDIGDAGVEALAGSEHLRNLTTLSLWYNGIGEAGARALAGSEHLRNLTSLNLGHNDIGDAGARRWPVPNTSET